MTRTIHLAVAMLAAFLASDAGAAKVAKVAIVNPGFESTKPGVNGNPEGWATFQHAGPVSYDFVLDSGEKKSGTQSLRIHKFGPEVYGSATQVVPAGAMAGKKVRLSAWVRTKDIPSGREVRGAGAALVLVAVQGSAILESEMMRGSKLRGTTPWTRHTIELAIPARATGVEVGAMLQGGGTAWIDDLELEIVEP